MATVFAAHLSPAERDYEMTMLESMAESARLDAMAYIIEASTRASYLEVEKHVLETGGSLEDLEAGYMMVEAQQEEKKDGLFSKVLDWINNAVQAIVDCFKNIFGGPKAPNVDEAINDNQEDELPQQNMTVTNTILSSWDTVKREVGKFLSDALHGQNIAGTMINGIGTSVIGSLLLDKFRGKRDDEGKTQKVKGSEEKSIIKRLGGVVDDIKGWGKQLKEAWDKNSQDIANARANKKSAEGTNENESVSIFTEANLTDADKKKIQDAGVNEGKVSQYMDANNVGVDAAIKAVQNPPAENNKNDDANKDQNKDQKQNASDNNNQQASTGTDQQQNTANDQQSANQDKGDGENAEITKLDKIKGALKTFGDELKKLLSYITDALNVFISHIPGLNKLQKKVNKAKNTVDNATAENNEGEGNNGENQPEGENNNNTEGETNNESVSLINQLFGITEDEADTYTEAYQEALTDLDELFDAL